MSVDPTGVRKASHDDMQRMQNLLNGLPITQMLYVAAKCGNRRSGSGRAGVY
jgi:hypothetical protein